MTSLHKLYDFKRASDTFGIPIHTLRNHFYKSNKTAPTPTRIGHRLFFTEQALNNFIETNTVREERLEMKLNEYRHSASKGNDWYNNPSLWIYRNLLGVKTETTPRMGMGNSAEFGCAMGLFLKRSDAEIVKYTTDHMVQQFDGEWFDETDKVSGIALNLHNAIKEHFPDAGVPHLYQSYKRHSLSNLEHPITTVTDFEYENMIVDTKATLAVPSKPREDHVRQQSLYSILLKKPATLVYASHKKSAVFELDEETIMTNYETMINSFESLELFMRTVPNIKTFKQMIPLNTDGYKWNDEDRKYAKENWNN